MDGSIEWVRMSGFPRWRIHLSKLSFQLAEAQARFEPMWRLCGMQHDPRLLTPGGSTGPVRMHAIQRTHRPMFAPHVLSFNAPTEGVPVFDSIFRTTQSRWFAPSYVRPTLPCPSRIGTLVCGLLCLLMSTNAFSADDPPLPQSIDEVREQVKIATQYFKDGKFSDSAAVIEVCNQALVELVLQGSKKDLPEWERIHRQLGKAAERLSLEGAEFSPMLQWSEIVEQVRGANKKNPNPEGVPPKINTTAGKVSFSKDIAPWMIETCGRCHVDKASGGFTMATYEQLAKGSKAGVVLFPGDAESSPLVSMIEGGTMPPNGNKVSPERLASLKAWVQQGAQFDGPDPKAPLRSLLSQSPEQATMAEPDQPVVVKEGTGKETVSFARDIAPLLVANCNGCHYGGNRTQGGLSFNAFAGLLKGGASGAILKPGDGDESLLVKKLRGSEGARMPAGGRPPLSDESIQLVKTWIDEGATFDGESRDSQLDSVIAKSWASKASHEELSTRRQERARARWQVVAPKSTPDEAVDTEFHVVGNVGASGAKQLLETANAAAKTLRKQLKLSAKEPLVKGGITLYALKSRYDYSELGTMLEKRGLPAEWSGHWKKDVLDMYVAMVFDKSDTKLNEAVLLQQLTSVWVASHDGVPKWFADGAGRNALANSIGQNDARVQTWSRRFPQIATELKNIQPVLDGKMNDEDEAILGFGIIRTMQQNQLKRQYELILKNLSSGMTFEDAFGKVIGPVDAFLMKALGKAK